MNKATRIILGALIATLLSSYICMAADSKVNNNIMVSTDTCTASSTYSDATITQDISKENNETIFSMVYDDFYVTVDGVNIDEEHSYDLPQFSDVIDGHKYYFELNTTNKNVNEMAQKINTNNINCTSIHVLEEDKDFLVNSQEELLKIINNYPKEEWTRIYFSDGNVLLTNNRTCNLGILRFNNKVCGFDYMDGQNKDYWEPREILCDKKINCGFCEIIQFLDNEDESLSDLFDKRAEEYRSKYTYYKLHEAKEGEDERYIPTVKVDISTITIATVAPDKSKAKTDDNSSLIVLFTMFAGIVGLSASKAIKLRKAK